MSPTLITTLTLISGISWSIVYIDIIYRKFRELGLNPFTRQPA